MVSFVATLSLKASAVVVQGVTTWISKGDLEAGHLLPSERLLAKEFNVSRKAVRRAIMLLAENGVVRSHPSGARTIASSLDQTAGGAASSQPIAKSFVQQSMAIVAADVRVSQNHRGFDRAIAAGVAAAVQEAGYHSIVIHPHRADGEASKSVEELLASRPAGMLLPEPYSSEFQRQVLKRCVELNIPAVLYGGSPEFGGYDRVTSDHESGTYELTRWLIGQGRKRITQMSPYQEMPYWFAGRRAGFERAIREADLELLPLKKIPTLGMETTLTEKSELDVLAPFVAGHIAADVLGPNPTDAFVGLSDSPSHHLIAACEFLGLKVPQDVLIVGYDNYADEAPEYAFMSQSVPATVDKRNHEIGAEMVRLMLARIDRRIPAEPQTRIVMPRLVIKE